MWRKSHAAVPAIQGPRPRGRQSRCPSPSVMTEFEQEGDKNQQRHRELVTVIMPKAWESGLDGCRFVLLAAAGLAPLSRDGTRRGPSLTVKTTIPVKHFRKFYKDLGSSTLMSSCQHPLSCIEASKSLPKSPNSVSHKSSTRRVHAPTSRSWPSGYPRGWQMAPTWPSLNNYAWRDPQHL